MKPPLTPDSEFIVGEEKVLDIVLGVLFLAIGIYGIVDLARNNFNSSVVLLLALGPAIIYFRKAKSKRIYIRINNKGIFQNEVLVTTWPFLLNAFIDQAVFEPLKGSWANRNKSPIRDDFILVLEYLKEGEANGFRRKIPLTNTQNKSEEDVIAAVRYFWELNGGSESK